MDSGADDGDSITCDGTNMRDMGDGAPDVSGYDTPEIRRYKCEQEFALGRAAKTRMETRLLRSIVAHWNVSSARGCGILH